MMFEIIADEQQKAVVLRSYILLLLYLLDILHDSID
jgi:hypothetical protein